VRPRALGALLLATALGAAVPVAPSHGAASGAASEQAGTTRVGDRSRATERTRQAARDFLDRYVEADGRVVRHDQGGDSVSEGQSYALLLAEVVGDDAAFDRIWRWTDAHLRRPDGLLATQTDAAGTVTDDDSASDADLVVAWALLRSRGPARAEHQMAGLGLAAAVLEHETRTLPDGRHVLAAGTWATGEPITVNPSYWAFPAYRQLATLTGDPRWTALGDDGLSLLRELTTSATLPPDWARIDAGVITPTPSPSGQVPQVRYSLDAQRALVWAATADDDTHTVAAEAWPVLRGPERPSAAALDPRGEVLVADQHPLALIAAAAAASAADHPAEMRRLLARADRLDAAQPSYYGAAWVALGRALLTTHLLAEVPA
jgi:endoglucanase